MPPSKPSKPSNPGGPGSPVQDVNNKANTEIKDNIITYSFSPILPSRQYSVQIPRARRQGRVQSCPQSFGCQPGPIASRHDTTILVQARGDGTDRAKARLRNPRGLQAL